MGSDRRIHVLLMLPSLVGGGAERVMVTLLKHLDSTRFRLTLCLATASEPGRTFRSAVPSHVKVIDLGSSRVRDALPLIVATIRREKPDVVLSTLSHLNLALSLCRVFMPRKTVFIARETSIVSESLKARRAPCYWWWAYRLLYPRFDRLVCQSEYMARDLIRYFRIPSNLVQVIHNPVDIEFVRQSAADAETQVLARQAGHVHLVAAGRLVDVKGFDMLIAALALCKDLPIHLHILGTGPNLPLLRAQVARSGVTNKVSFEGFLPNPYGFFRAADAFVLSSRYEGFPNVVLEALACGTPVIAMPAPGGTQEILKGMEGCVITPSVDHIALADTLRQFVAHANQRVRMPPDCVDRFRAPLVARMYEELFVKAVEIR